MATYSFEGYAPGVVQFLNGETGFPEDGSAVGVRFRIDPGFDASIDRYQYEVTETSSGDQFSGDMGADEVGEDSDQFGTVRDASGTIVGGGPSERIYLEHGYSVQAPDGTVINFFTVEVAGVDMGVIADAQLQPGVTYEIISQADVGTTGPFYSDFGTVDYNPEDDNDIEGGAGADSLAGAGGDDSIFGGEGSDTIEAGGGNDVVEGGFGDDSIDGGNGSDTVLGGSGSDTITGDGGNDSIGGGEGADSIRSDKGDDTIEGGGGNDSIDGGAGADVISGDAASSGRVGFKWSDVPDPDDNGQIDDEDTTDSGSVDVAGVNVSFVYTGTGVNDGFESSSDQYVAGIDGGSETPNQFSGWHIGGDHTQTSQMEISFDQEVENVQFRINDIENDGSNQQEQVTVRAFDADNNSIEITLVFGSGVVGSDTDGVPGADTGIGTGNATLGDASGSMLLSIPGPVSRIEIEYSDIDTSGSGGLVGITDIYFDEPAPLGNDTIDGGAGNDVITTGGGYDTVVMSDGGGNDTVADFDMGDDDSDGFTNDQLDLSGLTDAEGNPVQIWDVTVTDDGSGNALLSFPNGESLTLQGVTPAQANSAQALNSMGVPCFTEGTLIRTPIGHVPIDDLRVGDLVITRDNGPKPIRWIGRRRLGLRELQENQKLRPVLIQKGAVGNAKELLVSPQHGILIADPTRGGDEKLVRAIHLAQLPKSRVRIAAGKRRVAYIHILFD